MRQKPPIGIAKQVWKREKRRYKERQEEVQERELLGKYFYELSGWHTYSINRQDYSDALNAIVS